MSSSTLDKEESKFAQIEGEFCHYPQPVTEISNWETLTLSGLREIDRIIRLLARKVFSIPMQRVELDANLRHVHEAIEFYSNPKFLKRRELFFRRPTVPAKVCVSAPHRLSHGEVIDVSFRSNYEPLYKPFTEEFHSYKENRTAHARIWRHPKGKSRGKIVLIHGWFMGDQRLNAVALVPGFFFRLGLDVILYELPYHGRRAPIGRNTALFPSADIIRTNEAIGQAIHDLRALRLWLREEDKRPLGVAGISLGGYTAALWSSLDRLSFAIPIAPLVSMAEIAWGILQEMSAEGNELATYLAQSLTLEDLRRGYAIHSPLEIQPKVGSHRRLIVAGLGDSVIPASQPHALWEHWDRPLIHWFSGDHLGQLSEETAFNEVHRFLRSLRLARKDLLEIKES